jgi:hypothetical protein
MKISKAVQTLLHGFSTITIWPQPLKRKHLTDTEAIASDWKAVGDDLRKTRWAKIGHQVWWRFKGETGPWNSGNVAAFSGPLVGFGTRSSYGYGSVIWVKPEEIEISHWTP